MHVACGVREETGWRDRMEDICLVRRKDGNFFLSAEVYDGHGGIQAAQMVSQVLTPYFTALCREETHRPAVELIKKAYLAVDSAVCKKSMASGAVAATFYIWGERFLAANVGDARIVIGTREGYRVLSTEHRPGFLAEKERIESLGGQVVFFGIPRVEGELAVSRAFGDCHLKPYVSAEPAITCGKLGQENDCVIVASDGVWDILTPREVVSMARSAAGAQQAADFIVDRAFAGGSTDNISVIVLDLRRHTGSLERTTMEIGIW